MTKRTIQCEIPVNDGDKFNERMKEVYGPQWPYELVRSCYHIQSWIMPTLDHGGIPDHLARSLDFMYVVTVKLLDIDE